MALKDRVRFILHHTGVNKNSMEYGVQSLAGDFEFANISLPYGDEEGRRMSDLLASEALVYPEGQTNDILMALWFIKFRYKKLRPIRGLDSYRPGITGQAWSFLSDLRKHKDAKEDAYRAWRKKQRDQEKVSVG